MKTLNLLPSFVILAFLFNSCDQISQEPEPEFEEVFKKITPEESEPLSKLIDEFTLPNSRISEGDYRFETEFGTLKLDEIIERISGSNQKPNYSIKIIPPQGVRGTTEYLIIESTEQDYDRYILQYEPSGPKFEITPTLDTYSGAIRILNLEREVRSENYFDNGNLVEEEDGNGRVGEFADCDCDYDYRPVYGPVTGTIIGYDVWIVCTCTDGSTGGSGEGGYTGGSGDDNSSDDDSGTNTGSGGGGGDSDDPLNPKHPVGVSPFRTAEEEALFELLDLEPNALIDLPCDQLQNFQDLATQPIPNAVTQRLEELSATDATFLDELSGFQNWHIQDLNNANGTVVNMDFFPITIDQLPNGYTPQSLLEHIRMNINDFTNDDANFEPYPDLQPQESFYWSGNMVGTIIHIDMDPHDGTVIVTEAATDHWVFSVIRSPLDVHHPISGNREFGFTQNSNGSYTFYTRGVDRLTQPIVSDIAGTVSIFGQDLMSEADPLWMSFQDKIKGFVEQNGGSATLPTQRNQGDRPNWDEVQQFLNGEISLNELRNDC